MTRSIVDKKKAKQKKGKKMKIKKKKKCLEKIIYITQ